MTRSNWDEVLSELEGIYAKYGVPVEGLSDYYGCPNSCCNDMAVPARKLAKAVRQWAKGHDIQWLADQTESWDATSVPSPAGLAAYGKRKECKHETWTAKGTPSFTSCGRFGNRLECDNCGSSKYEWDDSIPQRSTW